MEISDRGLAAGLFGLFSGAIATNSSSTFKKNVTKNPVYGSLGTAAAFIAGESFLTKRAEKKAQEA